MFTGTSINTSPVISMIAGKEIANGGGRFVKVVSGNVELCKAGEDAFGALVLQTNDAVKAGQTVTVQIERRALVVAGGAVEAGAYVATDADGAVVTAASGKAVGMALQAAAAKGDIIEVLLLHGVTVA